jgi:hypothetical protein
MTFWPERRMQMSDLKWKGGRGSSLRRMQLGFLPLVLVMLQLRCKIVKRFQGFSFATKAVADET